MGINKRNPNKVINNNMVSDGKPSKIKNLTQATKKLKSKVSSQNNFNLNKENPPFRIRKIRLVMKARDKMERLCMTTHWTRAKVITRILVLKSIQIYNNWV